MSQMSFSSLAYQSKKKTTRREEFLREMESITPWHDLEQLIEPHYPKAGNGRPPMPLSSMLRIYFMQQWFNLSDPAMEDSLYDSHCMQRFAGLEVGRDAIPDETTILHFRHLLERHQLAEQMFVLLARRRYTGTCSLLNRPSVLWIKQMPAAFLLRCSTNVAVSQLGCGSAA